MANEKYSNSIISAYRNLIDNTIADMSRTERTIIDSPNIGTVRDGGKAIYSAELRNLLSILLTTYYSTANLDKWNELKLKLENKTFNYLFLSATNAAKAIEFTLVSNVSALEVNITGADVPTKRHPFLHGAKYVNVLYITLPVSMLGNINISD